MELVRFLPWLTATTPDCAPPASERSGTSTPNRIRTGAAAVKGRCPGPLDDGGRLAGKVAGDSTPADRTKRQAYLAPIGTPVPSRCSAVGTGTCSAGWNVQDRKQCTAPTTRM